MNGPSTSAWAELAQETLNGLLSAERVRRRQPTLALPAGVSATQIDLAQHRLNLALPDELIALYGMADGGSTLSPGTWFKLQALVLKHDAIGFQAHMLGVPQAPDAARSPNHVRDCVWHSGWLPLGERHHGPQSYWLCMDTAPGAQGRYGQLIEVPCIRHGLPPAGLRPRWVAPSLLAYLAGLRRCLKQHQGHDLTQEVVRSVSGTEHGWHWVEAVLGEFSDLPAPPQRAALGPSRGPAPSTAALESALQGLRRPSTTPTEPADLQERVYVHDVRFLPDPPESFAKWSYGTRDKPTYLGPALHAWARGRFSPRVLVLTPAGLHHGHVVDQLIHARQRREGQSPSAWLRLDALDHLEAIHSVDSPLQGLAGLLAAEARRRQVPSLADAWLAALGQGRLNLVVLHGEALWLANTQAVPWGADLAASERTGPHSRVLWLVSQQGLDQASDVHRLIHGLSAWTLAGPTQATMLWVEARSADLAFYSAMQALREFGLAEDAEALALWRAQEQSGAEDHPQQEFPQRWLQHLLQRVLPQQRPPLVKLVSAVKQTLLDKASSAQVEQDVAALTLKRVAKAVARWPADQQRQARYLVRRWLGLHCQDQHWAYSGEPWWRLDPVPALLAAMSDDDDAGVCAALQGEIDISEIQNTVIEQWKAQGHTAPYTGTARLLTRSHPPSLTGRLLALACSMTEVGWASQGDFVAHVRAQQALTLPNPPQTAQLAGADLRYVSLFGMCLAGADLRGVVVEYANFRQVDLSQANLSGIEGQGCNFVSCCLRGANLDQAKLPQAYLTGSDLRDISFSGLRAPDSDWTDAQWNQMLGSTVVAGARGTYHGVTPATRRAPQAPIRLSQWPQAEAHLLRACPRGKYLIVAFPGGELFAADPDTLQALWGWWLPDGPAQQVWMHDEADMFISVHDAKAPPLMWNIQTGQNFHRMSKDSRDSGAFVSVGLEHPCWRRVEPIKRHPGWLFTSGYQTKSIELVHDESVMRCSTAPTLIPGPGKLRSFATWSAQDLVVWCTDDRIEVTPLSNPTGSRTKVAWAPTTANAVYTLVLNGQLTLVVAGETGLMWGDIAAPEPRGAVAWADLPEPAQQARPHLDPNVPWLLLEGPGLRPTVLNLYTGHHQLLAESLAPGTPATLGLGRALVWEDSGLRGVNLPLALEP